MSGEANAYNIFGLLIDKEIALLFLGAIIGFGASLGTSLINNRMLRKKEWKEKAIGIILNVVKFFLKINIIARDTKDMWGKFRMIQEDIRQELEVEELYHEVNLDLLDNQNIRKQFRALLNAYYEYVDAFDKDQKTLRNKEAVYRKLYKEFMYLCVNTCKANAPIRTLSAPDKKKGPSRKS